MIGICGASNTGVLLNPSIQYIGVDGGNDILAKANIIPILSIGDFDSIQNHQLIQNNQITLPKIKDYTDTEYAIIEAIKLGYQEIEITGVTGGRIDHFMAMICLLQKYNHINIKIVDLQNEIFLLKKGRHIIENNHDYFSLFALKDTNISIRKARYEINNYKLKTNDPLCVSNEGINPLIIVDQECICIKSKNDIK